MPNDMQSTCCGKKRDTKFCPDCGGRLSASYTLNDLLNHCRKQAETQTKSLATRKYGDDRYRARYLATIGKWELWAKQLAELLESGTKDNYTETATSQTPALATAAKS